MALTDTNRDETDERVRGIEAAREAGLRYVSDTRPGIRRKRRGKHFGYIDQGGQPIHDQQVLQRIRSLAIPPAWTDVWICPSPLGHLQATGRDAKGRKQYRYHSRWCSIRDATKYEKMIAFGHALPLIRAQVSHDLAKAGLPREKILAALVRLLDTTSIRIGNEEYMRENGSFGLTTMRKRHADVDGGTLHFQFRGKSGKQQRIDLQDRQLARIVKRCQELPGQELFQYLDSDQTIQSVGSGDVNDYLYQIMGQDFTTKDFRTWAATVEVSCTLQGSGKCDTLQQAKQHVSEALEVAAQRLGNTVAVCRKSYVHPQVIDVYLNSKAPPSLKQQTNARSQASGDLYPEERALLQFLEQQADSDRMK